jgi:hypothetical protein
MSIELAALACEKWLEQQPKPWGKPMRRTMWHLAQARAALKRAAEEAERVWLP